MALISVAEAAEQLGVTPERLYQRINTGSLPAQRIGRHWAIDTTDLNALSRRPSGRPLSPTSAWALIAASRPDSDAATQFTPPTRSRARARYTDLLDAARTATDLADLATLLQHTLGARARRVLYRASPLDLPALRDDPRLHLSGLSSPAARISAGDIVEGYARPRDLNDLEADHLLTPANHATANVVMHATSGTWDITDLYDSTLTTAADLAQHQGPRERSRAHDLIIDLTDRPQP